MTSPRPDAAAALAAFLAKGKSVTRVASADAETVKQASRDGWKRSLRAEAVLSGVASPVESYSAENQAERMAEHFSECALSGVSSEVAMEDWNYMNGNGASKRTVQKSIRREMDDERGW